MEMTPLSLVLKAVPRERLVAAGATGAVALGGLAIGAVAVPAFGSDAGCSSRSQTVYTGHPDIDAEIMGKANEHEL